MKLNIHARAKRFVKWKQGVRKRIKANPDEGYNTLHIHEAFVYGFRAALRTLRSKYETKVLRSVAFEEGRKKGFVEGTKENPTRPEGAYLAGYKEGRQFERDTGESARLAAHLKKAGKL